MPDVLLRLRLSDLKPQWLPAMLTLLHCIHFGAIGKELLLMLLL